MPRVESASSSSLLGVTERLVGLLFVGGFLPGYWGEWPISFLLVVLAICISAFVGYVRVYADEAGIHLRWMWLQHVIPWESVRSVVYKAELLGGRLEIDVWTSETLRISNLDALKRVSALAARRIKKGQPQPAHLVGIPWWLSRLRPSK